MTPERCRREDVGHTCSRRPAPTCPCCRSAPFVRNSGQLVSRAPALFDAARQVADVVIVEAPPFLAFHHGEAMAHAVDSCSWSGECGVTTFDEADGPGTCSAASSAPVLGVVFTEVPIDKAEKRVKGAPVGAPQRRGPGRPQRGAGPAPAPGRTIPRGTAGVGPPPPERGFPMGIAAQVLTSNPLVGLVVVAVLFGIGRLIIRGWPSPKQPVAGADPQDQSGPPPAGRPGAGLRGPPLLPRHRRLDALQPPGEHPRPQVPPLRLQPAGANVRGIVNDGSVSIATGIVMAIVGSTDRPRSSVFAGCRSSGPSSSTGRSP